MKRTDTKERILQEAVKLFAKKGYDAVGVAEIADAVGIRAPSLYKHYKSKREIFDHIVRRLEEEDFEKATEHEMPVRAAEKVAEGCENVPFEKIRAFSVAMLRHWTEEEFSRSFRKMLTLERYKSEEMAKLYRQYLCSGPIEYMADIFAPFAKDETEAYAMALEFYGPMYLLYAVYDEDGDIDRVIARLEEHVERFSRTVKTDNKS